MTELHGPFTARHVGPDNRQTREMLAFLGLPSLETLTAKTVPAAIRLDRELDIPQGVSEHAALAMLAAKFEGVPQAKSLIGQGYHGTLTPPVILRNLFENPGWYTVLHAVSAGDQPGPAGDALQFPDAGERTCRPSGRQCVAARRSHRRCRGGGHSASATTATSGAGSSLPMPCIRRRWTC